MKLRNLNGAIRGVDGPVKITVPTKDGPLELCMVKSTLITNLKALYGDDNMVETGLFVDVDTLRYEDGSAFGDTSPERDETLDILIAIAAPDDDLLDDTFEPKVHPQGDMADDEDLDDLLG